ncbi:Ku protein [Salinifilum aidingensis]
MPPRRIWTCSINFGLVTIPVDLYSATEDRSNQFHQYVRDTADRVRLKRVNERTGEEVDYGDVVKGREIGDVVVTVEQSELDEVAPGRSRAIDIDRFVPVSEIDPVYFQRTYWLAPTGGAYARPYALLRRALQASGQAGIATVVLRGKQYLTALRAEDSVLALDTLHFSAEVRDPGGLVGDAAEAVPSGNEMRMAGMIIDSMKGAWEPEHYTDTYAERVEQLLVEKARGVAPAPAASPPEPTEVTDLSEVLRRSVDEALRRSAEESREGSGPVPGPRDGPRGRSGTSSSGGRSRGAPGGAHRPDLAGMRKSDLAERARQLGIRGRSKMSRGDLEQAVAAADAGGRSRRVP